MPTAADPGTPRLVVGEGDEGLDARLSAELDAPNVAAVGRSDLRELTVRVEDNRDLAGPAGRGRGRRALPQAARLTS